MWDSCFREKIERRDGWTVLRSFKNLATIVDAWIIFENLVPSACRSWKMEGAQSKTELKPHENMTFLGWGNSSVQSPFLLQRESSSTLHRSWKKFKTSPCKCTCLNSRTPSLPPPQPGIVSCIKPQVYSFQWICRIIQNNCRIIQSDFMSGTLVIFVLQFVADLK